MVIKATCYKTSCPSYYNTLTCLQVSKLLGNMSFEKIDVAELRVLFVGSVLKSWEVADAANPGEMRKLKQENNDDP